MDDLKKFVQNFNKEHSRPPTSLEIEALSKQGKAPSGGVFKRYGGLNWVIEQAGLVPVNPHRESESPEEVRKQFVAFVRDFISNNKGRVPKLADIITAARTHKVLCPYPDTIKRALGKTVSELMYDMGFSTRRPNVSTRKRDALG